MRTAIGFGLLALAACDASQEPSDDILLAAHPGGSIFVTGEHPEQQTDCPVPPFLFGDGQQVARGVSVPSGPPDGDGGTPVRRWGLWRYYHVGPGTIGEPPTCGHMAQRGGFRAGKRIGNWTFWYPDGSIRAQGAFVDGAMDGEWQVRTATGAPDAEHSGTYRAGTKVR
jgi:hypothetical protein